MSGREVIERISLTMIGAQDYTRKAEQQRAKLRRAGEELVRHGRGIRAKETDNG